MQEFSSDFPNFQMLVHYRAANSNKKRPSSTQYGLMGAFLRYGEKIHDETYLERDIAACFFFSVEEWI